MTFQQEMDDVRQEVRRGGSGSVALWPKQSGANVVASAATWASYDPDGNALSTGSGTVTAYQDGDAVNVASRVSCTIDASALDIGENYRVDVTYTVGASSYVESVQFDVVVEPAGSLGVSMNDLQSEQSDVEPILLRQAAQQETGRTAQQQAAVLGVRAWGDVRQWLKKKVEQQGSSWPLYIVNREDVRGVVVARALYRMIVAQGLTSADLREQADWWRTEAERRFAAMPALQFSTDEDRVPDDVVQTFSVVETRRTW